MTELISASGHLGLWLLGDTQRAAAAADALREAARSSSRVLQRLNAAAQTLLTQRMVTALRDLLDDDLVAMLAAGWREYRVLREAAAQTVQPPGSERVVALAEHQVVFERKATLEVRTENQVLLSVPCDARVVFDVTGLAGIVRVGVLTALSVERVIVQGTLIIAEHEIHESKVPLTDSLLVQLGRGVPLLMEHPYQFGATVRQGWEGSGRSGGA